MYYSKLNKFDTANGEGIRVSLFVSGCSFACKGCFNKAAWSYQAGELFTNETMQEILECCADESIRGISILGGEPLEPRNVEQVAYIISKFKSEYPEKNVWLWTGYEINELVQRIVSQTSCADALESILESVDIIVDGKYDKDLPTTKPYRGSDNQIMWQRVSNNPVSFRPKDL